MRRIARSAGAIVAATTFVCVGAAAAIAAAAVTHIGVSDPRGDETKPTAAQAKRLAYGASSIDLTRVAVTQDAKHVYLRITAGNVRASASRTVGGRTFTTAQVWDFFAGNGATDIGGTRKEDPVKDTVRWTITKAALKKAGYAKGRQVYFTAESLLTLSNRQASQDFATSGTVTIS